METNRQFRERLTDLFDSQNLAALSTHNAGQPYASLVAFYAGSDLRHIYFATPKTTRKFANLSADKRVAIMINNSSNEASDFHQAISVTAIGEAQEISGEEKKLITQQYLAKHPYLDDFVGSPTCAVIKVSVDSYYLVRNFQNVMELHLKS
ncbi:MAG: pyridoxamine 5'-phosphate oxidase family protein [Desulfobacterales bacterium]|jgi:nitroimidazol reductase NimA-like FMN-containing flavoprotein (pyridoxamine 5'-phosphate oxidase superfamily)